MNISLVKQVDERVEERYSQSLGIVLCGRNNCYPQELRRLIKASSTGASCAGRRAKYIRGGGFVDAILQEFVCNFSGTTLGELHKLLASDIACYDGFAFHVNYNILGEIVSIEYVPFENCRLEEPDDAGHIAHIAVHPDWEGRRTRNGKKLQVNKSTIDFIDRFNPNPIIVQKEIANAGGIDKYKGQIYYFSNEGDSNYPSAEADRVITELSSDEGLSNISYRNIRNNFFPSGMFITKKGQGNPDNSGEPSPKFQGYVSTIAALQGDTNAGKIVNIELETDEDMPEFKAFDTKNFDKEFTVTTPEVESRIYSAFGQDLFWRMRNGSIGFSGEIMNDLKREYCEQVQDEQSELSSAYKKVLEHWKRNAVPVYSTTQIKPLYQSTNNATNE
jgi:hypothetical protein